ncbi:hypothetical protein ABL78_0705 [Leptomonas seymouri]|uniref:Uncharacterized protein n=1 Tax=Leptomonas seymouri TaxID=5684 RepID=A0A0N0P919_LEPSE|nr:hypothetical protein ABL78_0705 [Leptomonas seymouri]|eukprot:KPI90187.1 hypothetical protein ABL78_0705 [Leptomonas seymouri]
MRRRNVVVDSATAAAFPDMEFVLLRCPKFYAKENIETVFPAAAHVAERFPSLTQRDVSYYLLYTFQSANYIMQKPGEVDESTLTLDDASQDLSSDGDDASSVVSSPSDKVNEDYFSELIQYTPSSVEWKDCSRERFFQFMKTARERIRERLHASTGDVPPALFMDWPDPATGLPVKSKRGPSTFNDSDAIQQFFSYNSELISGPGGGCRMIEHPRFGLNVYPAAGVVALPRCEEAVLCDAVRSLSL